MCLHVPCFILHDSFTITLYVNNGGNGDYALGSSSLHNFLKTHGLTSLTGALFNADHDRLIESYIFSKIAPFRIFGQIITWVINDS